MEKLKNSITSFHNIRKKYTNLGATNPEINYIFRQRIRRFRESGDINLPQNQIEWKLFGTEGSFLAAQELSLGLLNVIMIISKIQRYASAADRDVAMVYLETEVL